MRLADQEHILSEVDSARISNLIYNTINHLTDDLHGNPRRIKAFVNRCRLGLYMLKLHFPDLIKGDYIGAIEYLEIDRNVFQTNHARTTIASIPTP